MGTSGNQSFIWQSLVIEAFIIHVFGLNLKVLARKFYFQAEKVDFDKNFCIFTTVVSVNDIYSFLDWFKVKQELKISGECIIDTTPTLPNA